MEDRDLPPEASGFQSRSLNGQIPRAYVREPMRKRPNNDMRGRVASVIAFLRSRGPKRLIREAFLIVVGLGLLYSIFLWFTLPDISDPRSLIASQSSVIADRNGTELYRLYSEENRAFIESTDIPNSLKQAIVAIEDERYYTRGCLDLRAIARAFFRFGKSGGASTLTRQLARNALDLKNENIISRKLKEIVLGCQLESTYSKDELLALYLNWIPFGQNAYGIELASRTYFGVPAKDLTLAQSVILASIPRAPSYYSPYGNHVRTSVSVSIQEDIAAGRITKASQIPEDEAATGLLGTMIGTGSTTFYIGGRTDQVLRNMQDLEFIDEALRLATLEELKTITFSQYREDIRAPHFVLWVKQEVETLLGGESADDSVLNQGGLTIETTLDWKLQQIAESLITAKREDIGRVYEAHNIALVSVQTGTNEIVAYVGNSDYNDEVHDGRVDMAKAARQPGSSFKPFIYAAAFEKGFSPATVLYDVPTAFGTDKPQNFDGSYWGLTNIRKALGASRNIPAIKAFFLGGEEGPILDLAARMGVTTPRDQKRTFIDDNPDFQYGWPLALGAGEAPLTEMVQGYATFAGGGISKPLVGIKKITDRRGNILYEAPVDDGTEAIDPRIAYEITSVLSDVGARPGEYWQSVLSVPGFQAAAKTGTSNKCLDRGVTGGCTERRPSDLWTMGFTPNLVTGIWIGNADSSPLAAKAESLSLASPIWKDFMVKAHKELETSVTAFSIPTGIAQPQISTLSGQLPTECTPIDRRVSDIFLQENSPTQDDPACVKLTVDKVTGLLASAECPAEAAEERSFFQPQEVLASRFPQWQASVIEWAKGRMASYDTLTGLFGSGAPLPLPLAPTESCTLALTPGRQQAPTLRIDYPVSVATYPSFQPRLTYSAGSGIREIRFEIDGKPAGTFTTEPFEGPVQVPRSVKEGGEHTLTVTLVDQYYNTATDEVDFQFEEDRDNPSVEFTSPRGDLSAKAGEALVLEADATDDEGGIKYVQFYLGTRLLSTKPTAPYKLDWAQTLEPGSYELRVVATDLAGNESEDSIELTIEN